MRRQPRPRTASAWRRLAPAAVAAVALALPVAGHGGAAVSISLKPKGPGSGTVNGIASVSGDILDPDCAWNGSSRSGDCEHSFAGAETVQLTAVPAPGSMFDGWDGTCPGTIGGSGGTVCSFATGSLDAQTTTVRPLFGIDVATLTIVPQGAGAGTVTARSDGGGISLTCKWDGESARGDCSGEVDHLPETVTLTAAAKSGSTFAGYTNCPGTVSGPGGTVCTFAVASVADDRTVIATFADVHATITVRGEGTGRGSVSGTSPTRGQVIACAYAGGTSGDCTDTFAGVETITLVAAAAAGSTASWASCPGVVSGAGNLTCTIVVDAPADEFTARARFTAPVATGCTITGTEGDDLLVGTPGRDVICGLGGDDTIRGEGGDDELRGGAGDDRLDGGAGDDELRGEDGADTLWGRDGLDDARGGAGPDRIFGGAGADSLGGGGGADDLYGNLGGDVLRGSTGSDDLFGGGGADVLVGGQGRDAAHGGGGNDRCTAELRVSC